jgi:uncharacterized membrane protein YhaH (DUF805 family)
MTSFGDAIKLFWTKYTEFKGVASRSEYWFAILHLFLLYFSVIVLITLAQAYDNILGLLAGMLFTLVLFAAIIPSLAISWRRLHDINYSGGWFFIQLVPLVGGIVYFVLTVLPSVKINNKYVTDANTPGVLKANTSEKSLHDAVSDLKDLDDMKKQGLISEEEFQTLKKRELGL